LPAKSKALRHPHGPPRIKTEHTVLPSLTARRRHRGRGELKLVPFVKSTAVL